MLTARPGMKWSMPLLVASIGTRLTADQLVPVALSEWRDHDVVGLAGPAEAAVRPGDVDRAGAVDLGRGQRALAQAAGDRVVADRGDRGDGAPARAAVGGVERADRGLVGVGGRHDHRAVGPHDRLAADDAGVVGRRRRSRSAAVGRACSSRIRLPAPWSSHSRVAVAVERAGRGVVADDPVLVGLDLPVAVGDTGLLQVRPPSVERLVYDRHCP